MVCLALAGPKHTVRLPPACWDETHMPPCQAFIHSLESPSLPSMSTVSSSPLTTHVRESLHLTAGSPGARTGCYIPLVYLMVLLPSWSQQESELGTPPPQVCDLGTMLLHRSTVFCQQQQYSVWLCLTFVTWVLLPPSHGLGTAKMNFPSHFQWLFEIVLLGGSHLDSRQSPDTDRRGRESKQHQLWPSHNNSAPHHSPKLSSCLL